MATASHTYYTKFSAPIGDLLIAGTENAVTQIGFPTHTTKSTVQSHWIQSAEPFRDICRQLELYFQQRLTRFDVPLEPEGTEFQQQVWQELQQIPFGETASYSDIAYAIGNPQATRAVGSANGSNPIPILIPCHRVIGRDGSLTGFGGGLPIKRFLLQLEDHEQMLLPF